MSEAQAAVVALVCKGLSNKQIAEELYLSTHTVRSHIQTVMNDSGIHSRTGLAIAACQPPEAAKFSIAIGSAIKSIQLGRCEDALEVLQGVQY